MNIQTKNILAWLTLFLALIGTSWAGYDASKRFANLQSDDQEFNFGESSIDGKITRTVSLEGVIQRHLFGVEPVEIIKKVVEVPKVVNAPKTKLNLTLTGIISGPNSKMSFAMIEVQRGATSIVGQGSEIGKTGATLHSIEPDHILINRDGQIEKLPLVREGLTLESSSSAQATTVENVELSAAELAVLTEVGQITEDQLANNPLIAKEEEAAYTDEIFVGAELAGQVELGDDDEDDEDEEELDEN